MASLTGWALYDNSAGGKVTLSLVADTSAPNGSNYAAKVHYDGTGTPDSNPTPGYGGLQQALTWAGAGNPSSPGAYSEATWIVYKIQAKIPVGYNLQYTGNATGTGSTFAWLTSKAGTGAYQLYTGLLKIGVGGTLSTTGYLFVDTGPNTAFDWYVARFDQIDITSAQRQFMGGAFADETGVPRYKADLVTSVGIAAGAPWTGITSRPTELTDGRVSAGLDGSGFIDFSRAHTNKGALATLNAVGSAQITAAAVLASKLAQSDPSNLLNDTEFNDTTYWAFGAGSTVSTDVSVTGTLKAPRAIMTEVGNGTTSQGANEVKVASAQAIPIEPGVVYRARANTLAKSGYTGLMVLLIYFYKQDMSASAITPYVELDGADYRTVAATSDTVTLIDGRAVAPSDAYYMRFDHYWQWSTTLNNAGKGYFAQPRFQRASTLGSNLLFQSNGSTPLTDATTITSLGTAAGAPWTGITGAAKPADNATVGATWGTDINSRPAELTDGRVSAALTSAGDLNRDLLAARANTSNLLRFTAGGLYTGDLAATLGAAWGSNLTGRPAELTDGRVSAGLSATNGYIDFSRGHISKSLASVDATANTKLGTIATGADVTSANTAADFVGRGPWARVAVTYGHTAPASPATNDLWIDDTVAPKITQKWSGSAWVTISSAVTNTNQVTDGANLGGTATWAGVTGAAKPADGATANITMVAYTSDTTVVGNTATRVSGASAWNTGAYSREVMVNSASVAGSPTSTSGDQLIGLAAGIASASYTNIDFGLECYSGGIVAVYELGVGPKTLIGTPTWSANSIAKVVYDGLNVNYYVDGVLIRATTTTAGRSFHAQSSTYSVGSGHAAISFGPYTQAAILGTYGYSSSGALLTDASVLTSLGTAAGAPWTGITGATKPADNATVGAAWGSNLTGIPSPVSTVAAAAAIPTYAGNVAAKTAGLLVGQIFVDSGDSSKLKTVAPFSDGDVIYDSNASINNLANGLIPFGAPTFVQISVWGGGGGGGNLHGGGGSGYSTKHMAVTPGTTGFGVSVGAGGAPYDPGGGAGTNGTNTTITGGATITAFGGVSGATAAGTGGNATGGDTNTTGEAGDLGAVGNGGANLGTSGGARQTTSNTDGNVYGGGGSKGSGSTAGAGAKGRVLIVAKNS